MNSSPTKPHRDSNFGSQNWSKNAAQCNADDNNLVHNNLCEVKENNVERIPVITMNSSISEPSNQSLDVASNETLEIDANNNRSPLLASNGSIKVKDSLPSHNDKKTRNSKNTKQLKSSANSLHCGFSLGLERSKELPEKRPNSCPKTVGKHKPDYLPTSAQENPSPKHSKARSQSLLDRRKGNKETKYGLLASGDLKQKRKFSFPRPLSPRLNHSPPKPLSSPGAVVTSSRESKRKTSITAAAAAFAAATAGAPCSPSSPLISSHAKFSFRKYKVHY